MSGLAIPAGDFALNAVVSLQRGAKRHAGQEADNQPDRKAPPEFHFETAARWRANARGKRVKKWQF